MALVRWDPFAELDSLHNQVNSLFNESFGSFPAMNSGILPTTDVYTDDQKLTIEAHLPNFSEKEITVDLHDNALEIKAEHSEKAESHKDQKKYLIRESSSSFYRRIALPKNVNESAIKAHFDSGMLKVELPFMELPKPKRIEIKAPKK